MIYIRIIDNVRNEMIINLAILVFHGFLKSKLYMEWIATNDRNDESK
jgi:hypothetical protein